MGMVTVVLLVSVVRVSIIECCQCIFIAHLILKGAWTEWRRLGLTAQSALMLAEDGFTHEGDLQVVEDTFVCTSGRS